MNVAVIGAGIVGRLLAFMLIRIGYTVTLVDRGDVTSSNCSRVAAGMLAPLSELERSGCLIFHMGQKAIARDWPVILKELQCETAWRISGSIIVAHPRDEAELINFIRRIHARLTAADEYYKKLTVSDLLAVEPALYKFNTGYLFHPEGYLNNQYILEQLIKYLLDHGVKFLENTIVDDIVPGKIFIDGQSIKYDYVFDCRGLGGKSLFSNLYGIRGELLWVYAPDVQLSRPIRLLHPRYSLYIVPRPEQIYLIGATEIQSEDYTEISVYSALELLTAAYFVHPGFAEARILKTATHCRPAFSNYLPQIKHTNGLIAVNGTYRHGYLITPALVTDIIEVLSGKTAAYPEIWGEFSDENHF